MTVHFIASVAHEVNRAYCQSLGDFSQLPWGHAPQWQQESAIAGVMHHLNNPGTTPEESHESWMKHKQADGWVYGPVKDVELKQHPCMVPYSELPQEQRSKDFLFAAVVRALSYLVSSHRALEVMNAAFNPDGRPDVAEIKAAYAFVWTRLHELTEQAAAKISEGNDGTLTDREGDTRRAAAMAKSELEISQMLAVKALTR